jgi:hypothetical protein
MRRSVLEPDALKTVAASVRVRLDVVVAVVEQMAADAIGDFASAFRETLFPLRRFL